jgi:hypothetical protein
MIRVHPRPCEVFSANMEHIHESYLTSRKGIFRESPSFANSFSAFGRSEMPLGRGRENDFSKRRLTLKSQFLSSDLLKLQISRGRKSFTLRVDISLRYIFPLLVQTKCHERNFHVIDVSANSLSAFTKTNVRLVDGLVLYI